LPSQNEICCQRLCWFSPNHGHLQSPRHAGHASWTSWPPGAIVVGRCRGYELHSSGALQSRAACRCSPGCGAITI
jgi:hypothetical protein